MFIFYYSYQKDERAKTGNLLTQWRCFSPFLCRKKDYVSVFMYLCIKVGQHDVAIYCVGVTVSFESELCNKGESWRLYTAYWPLEWHWKAAQCHALRLRVTTDIQSLVLALEYRPLPLANVFQVLCLKAHVCGWHSGCCLKNLPSHDWTSNDSNNDSKLGRHRLWTDISGQVRWNSVCVHIDIYPVDVLECYFLEGQGCGAHHASLPVARLWMRKVLALVLQSGFDCWPVHAGFMVDKVAMAQATLWVRQMFSANVIPPVLHANISYTYHRCYIIHLINSEQYR
jgi:hypothetical protein